MKVCKAIGEDPGAVKAMEFMSSGLLKEKERLEEEIKEYEERVEAKYQRENERYMLDHVEKTDRLVKLKLDLVDSEYDGELEELEKMERDYEKIWAKRPFKGYVPEEEQSEGYLKNKSRLEEIKEDLTFSK